MIALKAEQTPRVFVILGSDKAYLALKDAGWLSNDVVRVSKSKLSIPLYRIKECAELLKSLGVDVTMVAV